jgi:hypothetical protein
MSRQSGVVVKTVRVLLAAAVVTGWRGMAAEPPPTAEQIRAWIQQLGDEVPQKREEAQAALAGTGLPALPALKEAANSTDAAVKAGAMALVSRLQWLGIRPDVNYLAVFPAESVFSLRIPNLAGAVERSKQTAVGKLLAGPDLKPLMDMLDKQLAAAPPALQMFRKWAACFNGQIGGAVWAFSPKPPTPTIRAALVAEIVGPNPEKLFQDFLLETQIFGDWVPTHQNGLMILRGPEGMGALALAGKHVILAANPESLDVVSRGLIGPAPGNLLDSPSFRKLQPHMGSGHDYILLMNMSAYVKMIGEMAGPQMGQFMDKVGYSSMDLFAMTSRVMGDRFEDRFVASWTDDKNTVLSKLMTMSYGGATPLKEAYSVAPAEAVAASNFYLDGAGTYSSAMELLKNMFDAYKAMGMPMPDLDAELAKIETAMGLKVADLAGAIKGDMVGWATLAPALGPPEIGISIGCADAVKAQWLAETLARLTDVLAKNVSQGPPDAKLPASIGKVERGGKTIFTETDDSAFMKLPNRDQIPYRISWAVQGSRLLLGTTPMGIEQRLAALEAKAPGLDPLKMMPPAPEAASAKAAMVLDVGALMTYLAKFGLPMAVPALGQQPELQAALATLANKPDIFKSLPPLAMVSCQPEGNVAVSVMWGPAPYLPTVIGTVGGVAAVAGGRAARQAERPPPPPPPPPDVKF